MNGRGFWSDEASLAQAGLVEDPLADALAAVRADGPPAVHCLHTLQPHIPWNRPLAAPLTLVIAVNRRIVGLTETFVQDSVLEFTRVLSPESFSPGANGIRVYEAVDSGDVLRVNWFPLGGH